MNEPAAPILVILTSDLSRLIPALGAVAAIRAWHTDAHIVALTAPDTAEFVRTSPYATEVWTDPTLHSRDIRAWRDLRARLRSLKWSRIYDLDANRHSGHLFWLTYGRRALRAARAVLPWSGIIPGTALAWEDPQRTRMHVRDQWAQQLRAAGIPVIPPTDFSWVARKVTAFNVPFRMNEPYLLIAPDPGPGGHWPRFADFARQAADEGRVLVAVGVTPAEDMATLKEACPTLIDLVGKTTVNELVFLAWAAAGAVGADNGVMHLAANAGCRSVVLYDDRSDPALVGQRGPKVTILRRPHLGSISSPEVLAALRRL
jgi:ADP-heptose:LPS heptosyltransferase